MRDHQEEPEDICNVVAEQQILGAIFNHNDLYNRVSDILKPVHFYDPLHRSIWETCVDKISNGLLVSPITLKSKFETDEGMKELGGVAYLVRCQGAAVGSNQIRDYARILIDNWARRELVATAREGIRRLFGGDETATVRNDIEASLSTLQMVSDQVPFKSIGASTKGMLDKLLEAYQSGEDAGISSGFPSIDNILGGLFPGENIVLGGTTSMGKTAIGLAIADRVAASGKGVAIISLEMYDESLASRLLSSVSKIAYQDMRRASNLSEAQVRGIIESAIEVTERPIYVVPPYIRDTAAIHGAVRAIKAEFAKSGVELGLVLVDYLQLVVAPGKTRVEQVTNASLSMKAMASMLEVPVLSLAQLSRSISTRDDKRPILSDFKDSSQIEQDADSVIFAHREHYWLERDKPGPRAEADEWADYDAALSASKGLVELIIAKNRHGPLSTVTMGLDVATNTMQERFEGAAGQQGFDM